MRALLILCVLMAWVWCVVGAIVLTGYLAAVAVGALRARPRHVGHTPRATPPGLVPGLAAYAVVMATCGVALATVVLHGGSGGTVSNALRWAALPWWSAAAATATAVIVRRRISAGAAGAAPDRGR